jgi:epsilon-lactone hydrolase
VTTRALDRIAARIRENVRKQPDGDIDVPVQRTVYDALGNIAQVAAGTTHAAIEIGGVRGERITPAERDADRMIVYLHGGGFALGSPAGYRALVSHIARACRAEAFVVDYRLAPEHPFPAAPDDAIAVWRALASKSPRGALAMMGDSAGGNLTLATTLRARDEGLPLPYAAVLLSPMLDLTLGAASLTSNAELDPIVRRGDCDTFAKHYCQNLARTDPRVSPLFADLRGLPPVYVQVGKDECLLDDSTRFAEKARAAGVDVKLDVFSDVLHVWHFFAGIAPESDDAIARVGRWLVR